jgi:FtsH-binding integral membrane protein
MDYASTPYEPYRLEPALSERAAFIGRTYFWLLGAVLGCIALVAVLTGVPALSEALLKLTIGNGRVGMLVLLFGCMGAQWFAHSMARNARSAGAQQLGLAIAVVAEALILSPLLLFAERAFPGLTTKAMVVTGALFAALTALVYFTRWNFRWLGTALTVAGLAAMGTILVSFVVPLNLGVWFVVAMLVLSVGYILYDTSNVMHDYPTHLHIAAALALFTSVTMLFWYVLRLLMAFGNDD